MRRLLIVTLWGPGPGGGEAFLAQTLRWTAALGLVPLWLCFEQARAGPYAAPLSLEHLPGCDGVVVRVGGGFSEAAVRAWTELLAPAALHHQGPRRVEVLRVATTLRVPVMTGFHFWHGAVILGPHGNRDVLAHAAEHTPDPQLEVVLREADVVYACSEFLRGAIERVTGQRIAHVIEPAPEGRDCIVRRKLKPPRRYVTLMSSEALKGAALVAAVARLLPQVTFLVVDTAGTAGALFRDDTAGWPLGNVRIVPPTRDVAWLYAQTKVLLIPSLVDETYCRVAVEGLLNVLPILALPRGNLAALLPDCCLLPSTQPEFWASHIRLLLQRGSVWRREMRYSVAKTALRFRCTPASTQYDAAVQRLLDVRRARTVMLFTPWCDQGLGIQSRAYTQWLDALGVPWCVLAYRSYFDGGPGADGVCPAPARFQAGAAEWASPADAQAAADDPQTRPRRVVYSERTREHVTDAEIGAFVAQHDVGLCLLAETCWPRVFEVAALLRHLGVHVVAIPNAEVLRRDELGAHAVFSAIWAPTKLAADLLAPLDAVHVGFCLAEPADAPAAGEPRAPGPLRLLLLGGTSPERRKQCLRVAEALRGCTRECELTICYQRAPHNVATLRALAAESQRAWPAKITLVERHMDGAEVAARLRACDVVVHVSSHEGIGLGLYQALRHGKPAITVDAPPQSEVIRHGWTGWTLGSARAPLPDNDAALIEAALFDTAELAALVDALEPNDAAGTERVATCMLPHAVCSQRQRTACLDAYTVFRDRFGAEFARQIRHWRAVF